MAQNEFITESDWPKQLFPDIPRFPGKVVEQVLNQVWDDPEQEESEDQVIGTVLGEPIARLVTIVRRKKK